MSFARREESLYNGSPISLFWFQIGTNEADNFYYASADTDISFKGFNGNTVVYRRVPIKSDNIVSMSVVDKQTLNVNMSRTLEIPGLFRVFPPSFVITLIIYQGHAEDPDREFSALWTGRVLNSNEDDLEATLTCEPVSSSLARPGLLGNYQYPCRVRLYGGECKAVKIPNPIAFTSVAGGNKVVVTPTSPLAKPKAAFNKGTVEWLDRDSRFQTRSIYGVTDQGDGTILLTLSGLIDANTAGLKGSMFAGCKHDMNDCKTIHNNIVNFRGCPWIPKNNPVKNFGTFT